MFLHTLWDMLLHILWRLWSASSSPLYTTVSRSSELSDLGSADYQLFDRAMVLDKVMRQAGKDASQELF